MYLRKPDGTLPRVMHLRVTVMALESNGYGVRESRLWCQRVTVIVLEVAFNNVLVRRSTSARSIEAINTAFYPPKIYYSQGP